MIKNVCLVSFYRHIILVFVPHEILPVCIWGEYEYVCGGSYDISAGTFKVHCVAVWEAVLDFKTMFTPTPSIGFLEVLMTFPAPN